MIANNPEIFKEVLKEGVVAAGVLDPVEAVVAGVTWDVVIVAGDWVTQGPEAGKDDGLRLAAAHKVIVFCWAIALRALLAMFVWQLE